MGERIGLWTDANQQFVSMDSPVGEFRGDTDQWSRDLDQRIAEIKRTVRSFEWLVP